MLKIYSLYISILLICFKSHAKESGFFTNAAALYLQAQEDGLSYAVKSGSSDHLAPHSAIKNLHFEWDFGFKVGVGYRIPHDRWECLLHFTSFQTHCDALKKTDEGNVFFPIWQKPRTSGTFFADHVRAHWRLHLGLLDLQLSKPFFTSDYFMFIPQIGIRNGWIRQKFNVEYRGGNFLSGENELIRMKNKYCGIGPMAGFSAEWFPVGGLSLFAKGTFSLLFGEFYLHQDEDTLGTKEKLLGIHSIFHGSAPIIDGSAGFSWQHCFSGTLTRLTLTLAWNQFLFFSQNQLIRFAAASESGLFVSNQGDLSLCGIEFDVRLDL